MFVRSNGASVNVRSLEDPTSPLSGEALAARMDYYGGSTYAGRPVSAESAVTGTVAVYACVRLLASVVGMLPLHLFSRISDVERKRITSSDKDRSLAGSGYPGSLARLLGELPNSRQTAQQFWEYHVACQSLWGNAYTWVQRDQAGRPEALWPLHPQYVNKRIHEGRTYYHYQLTDDPWVKAAVFREDEIWVNPWISLDGRVGIAPIAALRNPVANDQAMQEFGGQWFQNGAHPSLIVQIPKSPNTEKFLERAGATQKQFSDLWSGSANAGRIGVIEEGMTATPMTMPLGDMQFIEQRRFAIEEVCRGFGIAPWMIGETMRSTAWGTGLSVIKQGFLDFTIMPITTRIENSVSRDLGLVPGKRTLMDEDLYAEFQTAAFLKGDQKERMESWAIALQNRIVTPTYVAGVENLPFDENRPDDYENPNTTAPDAPGAEDEPKDPPDLTLVQNEEEKARTDLLVAIAQRMAEPPAAPPVTVLSPEQLSIDTSALSETLGRTVQDSAEREERLVDVMAGRDEMFVAALERNTAALERLEPKPTVRKVVRDEDSNIIEIRDEVV